MKSIRPLPTAVLLLAGALAFAETPPTAGASPTETPAPTPPELRLGDAVRPLRQAVELTLVPTEQTFSGSVEIELEIRAATSVLWLNGSDLKVRTASASIGSRSVPARVVPGGEDFIGFAFDRPLAPGRARLHVEYEGAVSRSDTEGLFAQQEGDDWYAFSQFEAVSARRAFPCFDEPSFKIPWRVTLKVRKDDVALSNTPAVSSAGGPGGLKTVGFAETKPMPSYLVAVAAGPFDVVDAGKAGRKATPVRIITPRGRAGEARWAVEATPRILALLEDYFDVPYPYEKLDQLAIPVTFLFGAMENAGLVTYREGLLVQKPEEETIRFRRSFASVCAHELAHQWFGDLVTMAWWDDVWLNESFASWMGEKITDRFRPEWGVAVSKVRSRSGALENDTLTTARRIRQPIESRHDIRNAFDNITYAKGEAVLETFESWLGEETFRKGVQRYLAKHAWGNATAQDFLTALSAEAGRDVAAPFSSFLEQTGAPILSAELQCSEDAQPRVAIAQRPYRPLGSRSAASQLWQVPVCVKYGAGSSVGRDCVLLRAPKAELALSAAASCPDWILANDGESGYYRARYGGDLLGRLLEGGGRRLTIPERVGLVDDVGALVTSGDLSAADALGLIAPLAQDESRHVVASTISVVRSLRELVPEARRSAYTRFVRSLYGEKARALGWSARPEEDEDTRLLRQAVIAIVGREGGDAVLGSEAVGLARRWLGDRSAIDADMVDVVLPLAARYGDRALFDALHEALRTSKDRETRGHLVGALGAFGDPGIAPPALAISLEEGVDPRESIGVVWSLASDPGTRGLAYAYVKEHFEALLKRLPRDFGAYMPYIGVRFCDDERRSDLEMFFKPQASRFAGGPRVLDQVLEDIDLCIARRRAQQPSVSSFLARYEEDARPGGR